MSIQQHKDVIRHFFEAVDRGDFTVIDELCTSDFVAHFPATPEPVDREGLRQFLGMLHAAFPDGMHQFEDQVSEGDKVVSRWSFRGVHQGEFQGIPPTGRSVAMTGVTVERFVDGRIAETWAEWDALGMLQQLGVVPTPSQTPA